MAHIAIKDLEVNESLDKKALENLMGGRWVRQTYYQRYTQYYTRTVRQRYARVSYYYSYRTVRYAQTQTRAVTRMVWV